MSAFDWSTPTRKSSDGTRLLEPLPLEVYEEILSHFHENDDMTASEVRRNLSNVALACRYFSSIALPRIFAEMNLSGGCQDSSTNRFCRALANNQQPAVSLARYIKTCNLALFMLSSTASLNQSQNAFLSMYCVALGKMSSVNAIDLHCVTIDKRLIKAMKKLPLLCSLRLSQCQVAETEAEAFKSLISTLQLETLAVLPEDDWIFHFSFPSRDFNFRHLKTLEVDDWSIIQHLARHEDVFKIESLTIHMVVDPQILTDLFSRMPDVSQLHIYRMKLAEQIVFPNSILPKLSFFDGPPALAHSLVQSRPIKRIWLSGTLYESVERSPPELPLLGHDIWTVLGRSTASIREIIIPRHLYDVASLHRHLPSVSILKICWCLGNWAYNNNIIQSEEDFISEVEAFCERWPPNPSVAQIVFEFSPCADEDYSYYDLILQHKMLCRGILPKFPNVEQVNFTGIVNWQRVPSDQIWRANIPRAKWRYFYSAMAKAKSKLVDYGNCFGAVFDSNLDR